MTIDNDRQNHIFIINRMRLENFSFIFDQILMSTKSQEPMRYTYPNCVMLYNVIE